VAVAVVVVVLLIGTAVWFGLRRRAGAHPS
jgi:hypothetical protein